MHIGKKEVMPHRQKVQQSETEKDRCNVERRNTECETETGFLS